MISQIDNPFRPVLFAAHCRAAAPFVRWLYAAVGVPF
jgi:hypothetical protein